MSTFGEIAEPATRTAWEDWDSNILVDNHSTLQWHQDLNILSEIELLLIFEGKYLSDSFMMQARQKFELINSIPGVKLQLYKMRASNKYICILKDYSLLLSSEIVALLKPYLIRSTDVIAIQTKSQQEYQAVGTASHDCIIRMVSTTKAPSNNLDIVFPTLEQPNIISGVSAGVICLREHMNLPGTAIMCYMEYPEEYQIGEVEKLLEKLNISIKSSSRPSSVLNSNLYI